MLKKIGHKICVKNDSQTTKPLTLDYYFIGYLNMIFVNFGLSIIGKTFRKDWLMGASNNINVILKMAEELACNSIHGCRI